MQKTLPIITIVLIVAGFGIWWQLGSSKENIVTNFEECVAAGNPVMESYPRQCRHDGQRFVEDIGNELKKTDLIRLSSPRPNQVISSPLTVRGEARGFWFFEGDFPVVLTNSDGLIIAQGIAAAKSDWMTEEFVLFEAALEFELDKDAYSNKGTLILRKDNPSGLPENDDALEIPVVIAGDINSREISNIPTSADNAPPGSIHNLPVPDAVAAVRTQVAQELGINEGVVIVMSAYEKTWSSLCLGFAAEGEPCALVETPGYAVTVLAQGKERLYHTNHDGSSIRRVE